MSGRTTLLTVWNDFVGDEPQYHDWYDREHLPERLTCPSFCEASRYEVISGDRKYFTTYDLENLSALQSAEYKAQTQAPSTRTVEILKSFRGMIRAGFNLVESKGSGSGGFVVSVRRDAVYAKTFNIASWIESVGTLKVERWRDELDKPTSPSEEAKFRDGPDGTAAEMFLFQCINEKHALGVSAQLSKTEMAEASYIGVYRFLSRIERA